MRTFLILVVAALGVASCETVLPVPPPPQDIQDDPEGIFIVDITGKQWDITTAVEKYGLEADRFNYGLGPDAIPPINFPKMLEPGHPAYPSNRLQFRVIGANIAGDARAYRIEHLNDREVVNEVIGGRDVFVGWWPNVQLAGLYSRTPSGTEDVLTFSASGWTYDRTFVLYDYETESMWYHMEGIQGMIAISGPYEGREIEELRGLRLRWPEWLGKHPQTKFMCSGDQCAKIK